MGLRSFHYQLVEYELALVKLVASFLFLLEKYTTDCSLVRESQD